MDPILKYAPLVSATCALFMLLWNVVPVAWDKMTGSRTVPNEEAALPWWRRQIPIICALVALAWIPFLIGLGWQRPEKEFAAPNISDRLGWVRSPQINEQQSDGKVTARLRVRYSPNTPTPEIIRNENVLKPGSLQFTQDGAESSDPRQVKWTLLILTFERPPTVTNLRVSFEGGNLPYETKGLNSRNAIILIQGTIADKIVDVEAF
jgi:hypothetical protein